MTLQGVGDSSLIAQWLIGWSARVGLAQLGGFLIFVTGFVGWGRSAEEHEEARSGLVPELLGAMAKQIGDTAATFQENADRSLARAEAHVHNKGRRTFAAAETTALAWFGAESALDAIAELLRGDGASANAAWSHAVDALIEAACWQRVASLWSGESADLAAVGQPVNAERTALIVVGQARALWIEVCDNETGGEVYPGQNTDLETAILAVQDAQRLKHAPPAVAIPDEPPNGLQSSCGECGELLPACVCEDEKAPPSTERAPAPEGFCVPCYKLGHVVREDACIEHATHEQRPTSVDPEIRIYQAQAQEDAEAAREGRRPRLIKSVSEIGGAS